MTLTVRSATVTGATTKGSALTHAEMDENWNHVSNASGVTFTPSGSGAVSRTVASALQSFTQSGSYDTTANFNTATDALTETIGMHSIQAVAAGLQFKFPTNAEDTKDGVLTIVPYAFGMAIKLAGSGQNHDNRLEFYLGSADTTEAELSVRHNGNNTGALIQARNAGDTDGIAMSFINSTYPFFQLGAAGPDITKEGDQVVVIRNLGTLTNSHRLYIANTYDPSGVREYLQLGYNNNRGVVRTTGAGGGTQRPLDLDGSTIQFQVAGTAYWEVIAGGHLRSANGPWLIQDESDANPTTSNLDADDSVAIYNKADTFVIAYNNGGTMTYITIPLDGSTTTWTHGTSAP